MRITLPCALALASAAMAGTVAAAPAAPATQTRALDLTRVNAAVVDGVPMSRVTIQPNGWGSNPESATRDLDRIMRFYEGRPGFRRDRYVKIIEIGRGKFQSDGRCSYLAPVRRGAR
ncbi:MAG: hypothetical protein IT577_15560 [Verrucomicrobiae bacterium]|nr:hypothetical protein [Verrucomicrobiae bacterium]